MDKPIAKIAVSAANYQIDKPYDYIVPENLADVILPGMRVIVPFSKGNRKTEGIVLDLFESSDFEKLVFVFDSVQYWSIIFVISCSLSVCCAFVIVAPIF